MKCFENRIAKIFFVNESIIKGQLSIGRVIIRKASSNQYNEGKVFMIAFVF